MSQPTIIKRVLSELFDVYPSDTDVKSFLCTDGKAIDLQKIFHSNLVQINVAYCIVWNFVYKTYPTKKDFNSFVNTYGYNHETVTKFDRVLLEKILNTFFHTKLGLLKQIDIQDLFQTFDKLQTSFVDDRFIEKHIRNKLKYRYHSSSFVDEFKDNIIITTVKYVKTYKEPTIPFEHGANCVSGGIYDKDDTSVMMSKDDLACMSSHELIQYNMYRDNHMFMKLLNSTTVFVDADGLDETVIKNIVHCFESNADGTVYLLNHQCDWHDDLYTIPNVPRDILHLFPCISKYHITIGDTLYIRQKSLAIQRDRSIYYLVSPYIANECTSFHEGYDRYILDSYEKIKETYPLHAYVVHPYRDIMLSNSDRKRILVDANAECFIKIKERYSHHLCVHDLDDGKHYDMIVTDSPMKSSLLQHISNGSIPVLLNVQSVYVSNLVQANNIEDVYSLIDKLIENDTFINLVSGITAKIRYLFNEDYTTTMWKLHANHSCPLRTNNPRNGILTYTNFIIGYFLKNIENMAMSRNSCAEIATNAAVIVDNRCNYLSVLAILFTLSNLSENWKCIVYTNQKGVEFYKKHVGETAEIIHDTMLDVRKFHIDVYNKFMTQGSFWDTLSKYDRCLVFQEDGMLLRKGIEKFMHYDYVGAPWVDCQENAYLKKSINSELVGNGGFSLRSPVMMHRICQKYQSEKNMLFYMNINNVPEDVYFAKHLRLCDANMPKMKEASFFSSEEILNNDSLGFHKVWSYHHPSTIKGYFEQILEKSN